MIFLRKNLFSFIRTMIFCLLLQNGISAAGMPMRFSHLTATDGLSQSNVTCILQDSTGFMWFGTFNGLNRYDGYEIQNFNYDPDKPDGISHFFISALETGMGGYIWAGTGDGLNRYNPKTGHFAVFHHDPADSGSLADNQIESVLEDSRGRLWVATRNGGLDRYLAESESFAHLSVEDGLSSNYVSALFEDAGHRLWIAHSNGTVDILPDGESVPVPLMPEGKNLTETRIIALEQTHDGHIWIGSQNDGLFRISLKGGQSRIVRHYVPGDGILNSGIILSLLTDSHGLLWIGTEDRGIIRLNPETDHAEYIQHNPLNPSSLAHNSVWSVYEDHAGNIWAGLFGHGVDMYSRYRPGFVNYRTYPDSPYSLNHSMVNAVVETDGKLWIATDGGGLNVMDTKTGRFSFYHSGNSGLGSNVLVSIYADKNGLIRIGTWADGLYTFNPKTEVFTHDTEANAGLAGNRVLHICGDGDGGLWLANFWGGVTRMNEAGKVTQIYNTGNSRLADNNVRALLRDSRGFLWIGSDIGVDRLNPITNEFMNFRHDPDNPETLSKGFVHVLTETADSTIWIGTAGGLNRYIPETGTFARYTRAEGLPNNEINAIVEANAGTLWISTNRGISCFCPDSATAVSYDAADGLVSSAFNARCGIRTKSGDIIFGGNQGFVRFNPRDLKENPFKPPVVMTGLRVFNRQQEPGGEILDRRIEFTDHLKLSYRDAVFSFRFSALNYLTPEKNRYEYRMEGFDPVWIRDAGSRTAVYTNMDPGHYTFRVRASNNDGIWNREGAAVHITVTPPFWKTWWAYIIEFLLFSGAVYFVVSHFVGRQRLRTALKMEKIELENIFRTDQMKTRFFSNISHEFMSPLTLILSPLERLVNRTENDGSLNASLRLIHRNARRMQRMIRQLKDIQSFETGDLHLSLSRGDAAAFVENIVNSFFEYAVDHRISLNYHHEYKVMAEWFDADKLDKIIYNLLSNAFKYTPDGGHVDVDLASVSEAQDDERNTYAGKFLKISVSDTGIGIAESHQKDIFRRFYRVGGGYSNILQAEGSGIGLSFVCELVALYSGYITLDSKEGEGTRFTIYIPTDETFVEENRLVADDASSETLPETEEIAVPVLNMNAGAATESGSREVPVILVVEDDAEMREYISGFLGEYYRVLTAGDGSEGLKTAESAVPDLIVSDIRMPGMNGIELCNYLKSEEKTSHIPVILLTAYASREFQKESLVHGADAYLPKPFSGDVLDAQIRNLLESRRRLRKLFRKDLFSAMVSRNIEEMDRKFLERLANIVDENISEPDLNADTLAHKAGMSRVQLYRKLRSLTDQTVSAFVASVRMNRAVRLLEEKRMTVTDVAYAVGYNDLTYFARVFRKHFKKSPSEYRSGVLK